MGKSSNSNSGSYECNKFSLKENGQKLGSQGKPSANSFSLRATSKKPK